MAVHRNLPVTVRNTFLPLRDLFLTALGSILSGRSVRQRMTRRASGRVGLLTGDTLLTVAAILGTVCTVLVVVGFCFQVSVVLFRTGSMGPTIPAGSAALVRQVSADSVRVGDIVTVDRPGHLPITHRVVLVDGSGPTRSLTLRRPVRGPQWFLGGVGDPRTVQRMRS